MRRFRACSASSPSARRCCWSGAAATASRALLLGDPAGLAENYHIKAESQLHRVADRQCRLITVEPRDALRYGYRLCADVATNLLLKAQTLDAARRVVEQVSFTRSAWAATWTRPC